MIGEGRPAKALLDVIIKAPGASIDALVIEEPMRNPLAEFACRHGIRCSISATSRRHAGSWLTGPTHGLISANSTLIIPPVVLDVFEGRSLNLHPGMLPEYAGLHTHQWAIRNGEREFGVTVHRIERMSMPAPLLVSCAFPSGQRTRGRRCSAAVSLQGLN